MTKCVPLRAMKDTAGFSRFVEEAKEPVSVTKNGYDHLVVMTADAYQALAEQLAEAQLLSRIAQAETDISSGQLVSGQDHLAAMRVKHGF